MGAGIAQLAAQSGHQTILYDTSEAALQKGVDSIKQNLRVAVEKKKISPENSEATLDRIVTTITLASLDADLVIEAIVEKSEAKAALFKQLAKQLKAGAIFCSNTSSIPINLLAAQIPNPERFAGMHFFNPPHLMKLVEVISGEKTSTETASVVFALAEKMGKVPVMAKDAPGFIVNRIGKMYHSEPLNILEQKIASVETIDQLLEASGFKMGPFKLMDLIGLDVNLNVTKSLYEHFHHHPKFQPSNTQQELVDSGFLGKKTGRGFYKYE